MKLSIDTNFAFAILILVASLVGFVFWLDYENERMSTITETLSSNTSIQNRDTNTAPKMYRDEQLGLEFTYPGNKIALNEFSEDLNVGGVIALGLPPQKNFGSFFAIYIRFNDSRVPEEIYYFYKDRDIPVSQIKTTNGLTWYCSMDSSHGYLSKSCMTKNGVNTYRVDADIEKEGSLLSEKEYNRVVESFVFF